jgi:hypothetical protein
VQVQPLCLQIIATSKGMDPSIVAEKSSEAQLSELLALKLLREHEVGIVRAKMIEVGHDQDLAADIHTGRSRLVLRSLL